MVKFEFKDEHFMQLSAAGSAAYGAQMLLAPKKAHVRMLTLACGCLDVCKSLNSARIALVNAAFRARMHASWHLPLVLNQPLEVCIFYPRVSLILNVCSLKDQSIFLSALHGGSFPSKSTIDTVVLLPVRKVSPGPVGSQLQSLPSFFIFT